MAIAVSTPNPDQLFVGRETAAQLLDVSARTIDDAIRGGDLEAFRVGRRVLIRREALIQFAERVTFRQPRAVGQDSTLTVASA
jgi:excisionase family DNA binding protein